MERLSLTKMIKEFQFEEGWDDLESKTNFQRQ